MEPKFFMSIVLVVFSFLFFCSAMFFGYKYNEDKHEDIGFMSFASGIMCVILLFAAAAAIGVIKN